VKYFHNYPTLLRHWTGYIRQRDSIVTSPGTGSGRMGDEKHIRGSWERNEQDDEARMGF
jgi:hypothetical protein